MTKNTRFSPEVRQRAVRMVLESQSEYDSQWATICSIAPKIGCTPETLRVWVRQYERDTGGGDGGLTSADIQEVTGGSQAMQQMPSNIAQETVNNLMNRADMNRPGNPGD